jgi:DNA-binding MarR family transcriptional regulator
MDRRSEPLESDASYMTAPPPRGLFTRLARVALHLTRVQEESIRDLGLRYRDYTVLATLEKEGAKDGLPVSRLADLVLRPMGSITQIVDRLAKAGLVERIPDPRDRRMVLIAITAEGERVALHGGEVYDGIQVRVLEGMELDELGEVDLAICRLLEAFEDYEDDPSEVVPRL